MQTSDVMGCRGETKTTLDDQPALPRLLRGLAALARLAKDPNDTELALRAAVMLNAGQLPKLLAQFEADPEGRRVLSERPALDCAHVDVDALIRMPEGTLGRAYGVFMRTRGLTPEVFVPAREIGDDRLRYITQRLRQTHDLWHVLTGYDTDVCGEIELQAFMFAQVRTPFSFLVGALGVLPAKGMRVRVARRAWAAYRRGRHAGQLCTRYWEREFERPLSELREQLRLSD